MIRVFVGCAPNAEDAESQAVLEYSLRAHASEEVHITWMRLSRDRNTPFYSDGRNGWQTQSWSTPFTGFRFLVPELCDFKGRAIYTDSDVIFMADIAELWREQFKPGKCVIAKTADDPNRLCVSVWDCAAARQYGIKDRAPMAHSFCRARMRSDRVIQPFESGEWNCLDGEDYENLEDPRIKLIHYTHEASQPHLRLAVPRLAKAGRKHWFDGKMRKHWRKDLIELFDRLYAEAVAAGYTVDRYLPATPFGKYTLTSHATYGGHRWVR